MRIRIKGFGHAGREFAYLSFAGRLAKDVGSKKAPGRFYLAVCQIPGIGREVSRETALVLPRSITCREAEGERGMALLGR